MIRFIQLSLDVNAENDDDAHIKTESFLESDAFVQRIKEEGFEVDDIEIDYDDGDIYNMLITFSRGL